MREKVSVLPVSGWLVGCALWGRYLNTLMLGKGSLPANRGMTSICTLCVAMAATGMDTNPELLPHTAQLLLLSTTETHTQNSIIPETSSEQASFSFLYTFRSYLHT